MSPVSAGPGPVRWKPPNERREHYSTLTASMMFSLAPAGVDLKNALHRAGFLSWPPAVVRRGSAVGPQQFRQQLALSNTANGVTCGDARQPTRPNGSNTQGTVSGFHAHSPAPHVAL